MVQIDTEQILILYQLLNDLNVSPKEKIRIRQILDSIEEEDFSKSSLYEVIYEKTNVEEYILKRMLLNIKKDQSNSDKLLKLFGKSKPNPKEMLYEMYRKINNGDKND